MKVNTQTIRRLSIGVIVLLLLFIILPFYHSVVSTEVKERGGSYREGIIGTPRYINPVLAQSNADRDLTELAFSSLIDIDSEGTIRYKIADSLVISEDQKTYRMTINPKARFSDGSPITANDVAFTIEKIQSPLIKSPLFSQWVGVDVEVIGRYELQFTLTQAYRDFIYNLSIGVIPEASWSEVSDEEFSFNTLNIMPVSSGSYYVNKVHYQSNGSPETFVLKANPYAQDIPFIENIIVKTYNDSNELSEAYRKGELDAAYGVTLENHVYEDEYVHEGSLPRNFGIFFNTENNKEMLDSETRKALSYAIDRNNIVAQVFNGIASPIDTPQGASSNTPFDQARAQSLLRDAGWRLDDDNNLVKEINGESTYLSFSISVPNVPELKEVADIVNEHLGEIGVQVRIQLYPERDLTNEVVRPRNYDALLFGYVLEKPSDSFAFWHSSQKSDPGLNISVYENSQVDTALNNIRTQEEREDDIDTFIEAWSEDMPAIMLYSPRYLYLGPEHFDLPDSINHSSERFNDVDEWYLRTRKVWNFLVSDENR